MLLERIGPWKIKETLGSGGMGHVYLAQRDETNERAAVKVLTASLAREPGFVDRFGREIDAMRKLKNAHIVQLLDSGVDGENYYYAMDYVEGETLLALLRREKRLDWRRALDYAMQVCQALKSAHDTGIIHRDLKPSNLMVTPEGMIKLTDFGVAQVFASQRLTVTGGIIGTAEYMSPEQAQGKRATKQSDLYSLGAVLYAMITGRTPFSGSTAVEVIQKHKFGLFDRPRLFVPNLPERVDDTICKLLEKDPAKRFPDALVLQRHMEQLLRIEDFAAGSSGITLADSSIVSKDTTTVAVTPPGAGELATQASRPSAIAGRPGPATLMQGLMRAELSELDRGHWLSGLFNTLFVQVALLALIVGGGVWWLWPRHLPADDLFESGVALMREAPGPDWLRARREFFEPLIAADAAGWREKVAPYLQQIELYEQTRPVRGSKRERIANSDSEPQRFLQLALHYRQIGDTASAEKTLSGLVALLAGSAEHEQIRQFANQLLAELHKRQHEASGQEALLEEALSRARRLVESGQLAEARDVWTGLIALYGNNPGARDFVERALRELAEHPAATVSADKPAG